MWSERQTRMLAAMGLRVWTPPQAEGGSAVEAPAAAPAALSTRPPAPAAAPSPALRTLAPADPPPAIALHAAADPAAAGRAARIATLDWAALRDDVAACRACGLCATRRHTVFGSGSPQAHWMVVGEAPGADEDASGEPFVGAAGQLLDAMLRALQLSRAAEGDTPPAQRAYIANTLKCRPPGNRNPAPEELAQCEPYLQRQVALLQPRLILALGRFAVQALLRSAEPLGKLRGRVHHYQGVPVVVSYHPAYLLRSPAEKAKAWDDLCLAADTLDAPPA